MSISKIKILQFSNCFYNTANVQNFDMDGSCPLLSVDSNYYKSFGKCAKNPANYSDRNVRIRLEQDKKPELPDDENDECNDVIPDAEHEYRLRLRMLEYHFRNQPGDECFLK